MAIVVGHSLLLYLTVVLLQLDAPSAGSEQAARSSAKSAERHPELAEGVPRAVWVGGGVGDRIQEYIAKIGRVINLSLHTSKQAILPHTNLECPVTTLHNCLDVLYDSLVVN